MPDWINQFIQAIKDAIGAIMISVFNWQEEKIDAKQKQLDAANLKLKEEANVDEIGKEYAGMLDSDIVKRAIADGSKPDSDKPN